MQQQVDDLREQRNLNASKLKTGGKPDQATIDEGKQIKISLAERETLLTIAPHLLWPAAPPPVPARVQRRLRLPTPHAPAWRARGQPAVDHVPYVLSPPDD